MHRHYLIPSANQTLASGREYLQTMRESYPGMFQQYVPTAYGHYGVPFEEFTVEELMWAIAQLEDTRREYDRLNSATDNAGRGGFRYTQDYYDRLDEYLNAARAALAAK